MSSASPEPHSRVCTSGRLKLCVKAAQSHPLVARYPPTLVRVHAFPPDPSACKRPEPPKTPREPHPQPAVACSSAQLDSLRSPAQTRNQRHIWLHLPNHVPRADRSRRTRQPQPSLLPASSAKFRKASSCLLSIWFPKHQGDQLSVHTPGGDFTVRNGDAPVVLLSGAGITAHVRHARAPCR